MYALVVGNSVTVGGPAETSRKKGETVQSRTWLEGL